MVVNRKKVYLSTAYYGVAFKSEDIVYCIAPFQREGNPSVLLKDNATIQTWKNATIEIWNSISDKN